MFAFATSFSRRAAAKSGRAARGGVWTTGRSTFCGWSRRVRYAAVRAGAGADALSATLSWQVHARCTTFHSSGSPTAPAELSRCTPLHWTFEVVWGDRVLVCAEFNHGVRVDDWLPKGHKFHGP
jgi:hypothetical protein